MAIYNHEVKNGKWIEIRNIVPDDIEFLKTTFPNIHQTNLEDILDFAIFPKLDIDEEYLFMSDSIPVFLKNGERAENFGIHVFLIDNILITITKGESTILYNEYSKTKGRDDANLLVYHFFNTLYKMSDDVIKDITFSVQKIDDQILEDNSTSLIRRIAILQRNIIYFLTSISASMPLFNDLELHADAHMSPTKEYWGDLKDKLQRQFELLSDYEKLLTVLVNAHEMVVNQRTNRIITMLTIFSAIFLPLNLIAGIYGMNIQGLPFGAHPYSFTLIVSAMVFIALVLYFIFTSKKWL